MILNILLTILFGDYSPLYVVAGILRMIALCTIIRKCGAKKYWHGAIPVYGQYLLARCVGHETDGRALFMLNILERILLLASCFLINESTILLFGILVFPVLMVQVVYRCRIYVGLCNLFNKRKLWILLLVPADCLVLLYWGLSKKIQPQWSLEDVDAQTTEFFSAAKADVMDEGLTIHLKERSAKEWFNKKILLRDIHMYIQPGSMVLLLGGSGAGKTTLLNAVNGYEKADAQVFLNGRNIYSEYKQMQYDIGFVPQLDLMRGNDTVLHTLLDAATLRLPSEMYGAKRRERVDEVMTIFGLKPVAQNMVSKLSGGQRKRLSIAIEFLSNPSLFILDEPDSGLDGVMARELMQQLRNIANQGKIVIVITHTPDRVIDLFDDVIVLAKDKQRTGRLAYYGSINDARQYFGKDTMEQIVMSINRKEEGGEGRADEFVNKYAEVMQNG